MSHLIALRAAVAPDAKRIPIATAREHFAALGMVIRKTDFGDFRVNYRHGEESTAAYESDLISAIATGLAMIDWRDRQARRLTYCGVSHVIARRDAATLAMAF